MGKLFSNDWVTVKKDLEPLAAIMLADFLTQYGVPAVVGDADTVRMDPLIAIALGGVRVRVQEADKLIALELLAARARGDFDLRDDEAG